MILVVIEHNGAALKPSTTELLTFARRVGQDFGLPTAAVVLGSGISGVVEELAKRKVDRILSVDDPALADYAPEAVLHALKPIIETEKPNIVVTAHSVRGMDFMPRLAVALRKPFVAACVEYGRIGDRMILTRPIFNSKLNMKLEPVESVPYFLTLTPGAFPDTEAAAPAGSSPGAQVESISINFSGVPSRRRVIGQSEAAKGEADLSSASVIVAGGRGLKQKENFNLVFDLAKALNGAVGA